MTRFRISMAMLMGTVAVAAVDFWGICSLEPGSINSHYLFATGVMPVSSLLILVGLGCAQNSSGAASCLCS